MASPASLGPNISAICPRVFGRRGRSEISRDEPDNEEGLDIPGACSSCIDDSQGTVAGYWALFQSESLPSSELPYFRMMISILGVQH